MIDIEVVRGEDTITVSVVGEVDIATAGELEVVLDEAVAEQPATLLLDLSGVTFLDSRGVALLVSTRRELAVGPTAFALSRPSRQATIALDAMYLSSYFRFEPPQR